MNLFKLKLYTDQLQPTKLICYVEVDDLFGTLEWHIPGVYKVFMEIKDIPTFIDTLQTPLGILYEISRNCIFFRENRKSFIKLYIPYEAGDIRTPYLYTDFNQKLLNDFIEWLQKVVEQYG